MERGALNTSAEGTGLVPRPNEGTLFLFSINELFRGGE